MFLQTTIFSFLFTKLLFLHPFFSSFHNLDFPATLPIVSAHSSLKCFIFPSPFHLLCSNCHGRLVYGSVISHEFNISDTHGTDDMANWRPLFNHNNLDTKEYTKHQRVPYSCLDNCSVLSSEKEQRLTLLLRGQFVLIFKMTTCNRYLLEKTYCIDDTNQIAIRNMWIWMAH